MENVDLVLPRFPDPVILNPPHLSRRIKGGRERKGGKKRYREKRHGNTAHTLGHCQNT